MNIVVVGAQWGDEGKGKIVDYLAENADIVVRFSGGANAGHTIVHGETTYKLHLIPSGIIYPAKTVVLGTGMVIDLKSMFEELAVIEGQGIDWRDRIFISDRAHIVLPEYRKIDQEEDSKRRIPIGTTGRGIGIAYSLKAARNGIRIADLYDDDIYNSFDGETQEYLDQFRRKIEPMVINISEFMHENKGKQFLFEGAQGTLLDVDCGTYPFVSSGMSTSAGAAVGGAIGPRKIDQVLGVFKAYTTRVGNGPFPGEFREGFDIDLADLIREIGHEYGVTTGRPRRCGYLDLVALRYACRVSSIDSLVLTHLDVYDTLDEIKACVAYKIDGDEVTEFPSSIGKLGRAEPVTRTFTGWKTDISEAQSFDSLPKLSLDYLKFIEDYTETPIGIVSVGSKRKQTILRTNPWIK
jgi:adenylosuccinate synthase